MFRYNALKTTLILVRLFLGMYMALRRVLGPERIRAVNQVMPNSLVPQKAINLGWTCRADAHRTRIDVPDVTPAADAAAAG